MGGGSLAQGGVPVGVAADHDALVGVVADHAECGTVAEVGECRLATVLILGIVKLKTFRNALSARNMAKSGIRGPR